MSQKDTLLSFSTKSELMQTLESLQNELSATRVKCEEMEQAKADTEDQVIVESSLTEILFLTLPKKVK